jgi:hypothetical protein
MSNPTELPDLDKLEAYATSSKKGDWHATEAMLNMLDEDDVLALVAAARRAQPEGEAPQAEPPRMNTDESREYLIKFMEKHFTDRTYHRYIRGERGSVNLAGDFAWQMARALRMLESAPAATLSPLCGAQHAESGKEVAAKPPFPISDDEMAALRRFWECATDGEGYDVEKSMMQRLAEMGLVQRKSGAYYMATDFGLYILGEYTIQRAAQLDGGQEGSGS